LVPFPDDSRSFYASHNNSEQQHTATTNYYREAENYNQKITTIRPSKYNSIK
jgi:hypothetical protein